jgi:hypothetical protein
MIAAARILGHGQDPAPSVGEKPVADLGPQMGQRGARVLHGHELGQHAGGERPGVDDLRAVRVDDADRLAAPEMGCLAATGGNGLH